VSLAAYLNDHLAGATAVIDLLRHLEQHHPEHAGLVGPLRRDIEEDKRELEALAARLKVGPSAVRQAAGWVAEKFARLKMAVDDPGGTAFKLFESFEVTAVGIHGKRSLWVVLKELPTAAGPDYDRLIARADEQRARLEPARLAAARAALAG